MERQPGALTLSEDDRRVLAAWAADYAERTLSLFEARAPSGVRPRDAIDGLRAFARGEVRIGKLRALSARARGGSGDRRPRHGSCRQAALLAVSLALRGAKLEPAAA
jgi:hypothetical protein